MNYLVTGAAGFIGAALAEYLVNKGHNVTTIDNLSTGSREHVPHDVTFIEGNTYEIPKLLTPPPFVWSSGIRCYLSYSGTK